MSRTLARVARIAVCLVLILLAGCSSGKSPSAASAFKPVFSAAPCPFTPGAGLTVGTNLKCGFVTVQEDRVHPTGKTVKLAVAVFLGSDAAAHSDPIVYLNGGPGGALLSTFAPLMTASLVPAIFGDHDVVFFDQRGVGYSQPSLQCSETVALQFAQLDENLTITQSVQQQNQALTQCYNRLVGQGIDLNGYSTYEDAADVHDLISALHYTRADLYGVSYGTRLALEVMRDFPQGIRSVVLDSTYPPQVDLFTSVPFSMARSFNVLFAGCASSPTCNANHPNLASRFYVLVQQLNATPITVQGQDSDTNKTYAVLINGDALVQFLFEGLYVTSLIPQLPAMIDQVSQGQTQILTQLVNDFAFDTSVSSGMYTAVECADDSPYATDQSIAQAAQALDPSIRTDQVIALDGQLAECPSWHLTPSAPVEKSAVTSAIPTLILEGEYDPITPPAYGDLTAKTLSSSYTVLFPGTGHGVFLFAGECSVSVVQQFWTTPTTRPDTSCLSSVGEPNFQ